MKNLSSLQLARVALALAVGLVIGWIIASYFDRKFMKMLVVNQAAVDLDESNIFIDWCRKGDTNRLERLLHLRADGSLILLDKLRGSGTLPDSAERTFRRAIDFRRMTPYAYHNADDTNYNIISTAIARIMHEAEANLPANAHTN